MIYEYYCETCKKTFEMTLKLKEFTTTMKCLYCEGRASNQIASRQAVNTFNPYFDKIQNKQFNTKKEFETYCRQKNLYKPTQREIKEHRDQYADVGDKKESSHGNAS